MKRHSGRLLTAAMVALGVAILYPVGAKAVQFFNVYISDPIDPTKQVRVDLGGALRVGGVVQAQPALAATSLVDSASLDNAHEGGSSAAAVFRQLFGPTQKVALTSLTATNMLDNDLSSLISVQAIRPISGECGGVGGTAAEVGPAILINVAAKDTKHLDFPYPFVVPASTPGGDWCIRAFVFGSNRTVSLTAVGYVQ